MKTYLIKTRQSHKYNVKTKDLNRKSLLSETNLKPLTIISKYIQYYIIIFILGILQIILTTVRKLIIRMSNNR